MSFPIHLVNQICPLYIHNVCLKSKNMIILSFVETLLFMSPSEFTISHPIEPVSSFDDLPVSDDILRGIYSYGFERPSGVQRLALPAVLHMDIPDVVVQARSGSGKTGVFAIAAIHAATRKSRAVALILSPTRELAEQSAKVVRALGDAVDSLVVHVATGGKQNWADFGKTRGGSQGTVISGTPGKVSQLLREVSLVELWKNVNLVVLDEADELLLKNQGFTEQIRDIFKRIDPCSNSIPQLRPQRLLVSATLPAAVLELTAQFMSHEPITILMKTSDLPVNEIRQFRVTVENEAEKFHALVELYDRLAVTQSVVFCNTRASVDLLYTRLLRARFPVDCIHGDLPQKDRDLVLSKFRQGQVRVLICSDVLGRGIDVQAVSLVVSFDVANSPEFHLHRIGRCGRFGRRGLAVTMCTSGGVDYARLDEFENFFNIKIDQLPEKL